MSRKNRPRRLPPEPTAASPSRFPSWLVQAAALLLLVAASSLAYVNAGHKSLFFDDWADNLITNPEARDVRGILWNFFRHPFSADEQLARLTFALNCAFNRAMGIQAVDLTTYLVFNVAVHALNSCLVFFLLRAMLSIAGSKAPAPIGLPLAVALLFAVHPIHGSSVAYIAQRRGAMATTFYLLAVLMYLRLRAGRGAVSAWSWKRLASWAAIVLCYWLGFRSKSMAVTLPVTLLMIEFCLRAPDRVALRRYVRYLLPGLLLCMIAGLLFLLSQGLVDLAGLHILPQGSTVLHGPGTQLLTECRVFVHYWKLLLLPLPRWMCVDHAFDLAESVTEVPTLASIVFHVGLLGLAVFAAFRRWTLAAVGIFWFYITLLPYAVIPQSELFVEYKIYLPSVGLMLILAEVFGRAGAGAPSWVKCAIVGVLIVPLIVTTVRRNAVYQSSLSVWTDAVEKYPHESRPHANLGVELGRLGRNEEAIKEYRTALELDPQQRSAQANLGKSLAKLGRYDQAIVEYQKALAMDASDLQVRYSLGIAMEAMGRFDEALECYREVLRVSRDNHLAEIGVGVCLQHKGDLSGAVEAYRRALAGGAVNLEARCNLADCLAQLGRGEEAIAVYRQIIQASPRHVMSRLNLAKLLKQQGRLGDAAAEYSEVLKIEPGNAVARAALDQMAPPPGSTGR
ncbi:MAG TPA: tetratricopeptide repeat protein [Phycisphaerae bacterium]|nr:tetratricopeptide repeat protein [Phycisphaerae bacterium]